MVYTYAKGEVLGEPVCIGKLRSTQEVSYESFLQQILADGYVHCLTTEGPRITVGDLTHEWRIMTGRLFFRHRIENAKSVREVVEKNIHLFEQFPMCISRKFYTNMSSVGRGWATALFSPEEAKEFCTFFELALGEWSETATLFR